MKVNDPFERIEFSWPGTGKLEVKVSGNKLAKLRFSPEIDIKEEDGAKGRTKLSNELQGEQAFQSTKE